MDKIELVKDTINKEDIESLREWLSTYPRLTQGELVKEFEKKFSEWQNCKYSVFVNSGSSANLLMSYYFRVTDSLRNNKVIIPAVSWATTLTPFIQFGFTPYLCDADSETLGLDLNHLEDLFKKYDPALLVIVNVLGFPNKFNEIKILCDKYDVKIIEDDCEYAGSEYDNKKTGSFGLMSTKSFYFGHTISTIEGGIISTNDREIFNILKMLRSHGWQRDLDQDLADRVKIKYNIDDFNSLYSFIIPGFNVRGTNLQAQIGLNQLNKLDEFCLKRKKNFEYYQWNIFNPEWKPNPVGNFISNFQYPIITSKKKELVEKLKENNIECRPLIAGNLAQHNLWKTWGTGNVELPFANKIHENGLYIPNNPELTIEELKFICDVVNSVLKG